MFNAGKKITYTHFPGLTTRQEEVLETIAQEIVLVEPWYLDLAEKVHYMVKASHQGAEMHTSRR